MGARGWERQGRSHKWQWNRWSLQGGRDCWWKTWRAYFCSGHGRRRLSFYHQRRWAPDLSVKCTIGCIWPKMHIGFIVEHQLTLGTTHLFIGSSNTLNSVPSFLTGMLPRICHTLLALNISSNLFIALPPALAACKSLEELNITSNPLHILPVFLLHLVFLWVLIADATGISTLPDLLCGLDRLHMLNIWRNQMHYLPG